MFLLKINIFTDKPDSTHEIGDVRLLKSLNFVKRDCIHKILTFAGNWLLVFFVPAGNRYR